MGLALAFPARATPATQPGRARPKTFRLDSPAAIAHAARTVAAMLAPAPGKRPWLLTLEVETQRRTLTQNAKLHALWADFEREFGWDKGEAKDFFKRQHGPDVERVLPTGECVRVPKRSRDYDTREASEMLQHVYRIAAENGVFLPDYSIGQYEPFRTGQNAA